MEKGNGLFGDGVGDGTAGAFKCVIVKSQTQLFVGLDPTNIAGISVRFPGEEETCHSFLIFENEEETRETK
jgi:hypothetical protein